MSDRKVREPDRAMLQQLNALNEAVQDLRLRAFRGAVRTARADAAEPGIYNELVSVLEVVIPSGRWTATGFATFTVAAPISRVDLRLQIVAADPLTDEEFTGDDYDLPAARYSAAHTTQLITTLRCGGDLIAEDNVKMTLRSMNLDNDAYTLTDLRLALSPV